MTRARGTQWAILARLGWILALALAWPIHARAFDPSDFADPNSLLTTAVKDAFVLTVGIGADYKAYEPATALGTKPGVGFGIELTLFKLPPDLNEVLESVGEQPLEIPFLAVPRLHLHKGLGERFGFGFAMIIYQRYKIYSGDVKLTLNQPEEGPTFAIRLSYTYTNLGIVTTKTWSPQIVMSRRLSFADPYIGLGYQLASGYIELEQEVAGITFTVGGPDAGKGSARSFIAFTGVQFVVPNMGLQLTLEGSYSQAQAHSIGTKVGFSF